MLMIQDFHHALGAIPGLAGKPVEIKAVRPLPILASITTTTVTATARAGGGGWSTHAAAGMRRWPRVARGGAGRDARLGVRLGSPRRPAQGCGILAPSLAPTQRHDP